MSSGVSPASFAVEKSQIVQNKTEALHSCCHPSQAGMLTLTDTSMLVQHVSMRSMVMSGLIHGGHERLIIWIINTAS